MGLIWLSLCNTQNKVLWPTVINHPEPRLGIWEYFLEHRLNGGGSHRHSPVIFGRLGIFPWPVSRVPISFLKQAPPILRKTLLWQPYTFPCCFVVDCYDSPITIASIETEKVKVSILLLLVWMNGIQPWKFKNPIDGTYTHHLLGLVTKPQGVWQSGRSVPSHPERCQGRLFIHSKALFLRQPQIKPV